VGAARSQELELYYYLTNFELALASIASRYADLLSEEESAFISTFPTIPKASRALLTRMVMRKGGLFRAGRLRYLEIGDVRAAMEPLIELKWVDAEAPLCVGQLQRILTKEELIELFGLPKQWKKSVLAEILPSRYPQVKPFRQWWPNSEERAYQLVVAPLCERLRLLYFGNFRQDWSEFVLADLKIFTYERIDSSFHGRPFQSRAQIEVLEELQACRELLEAGVSPEDVLRSLPPAIVDCEWLEDRRQKLLFAIALDFERSGDFASALKIYLECRYAGARIRAVRLKERAKKWTDAYELCMAADANPENEVERQKVQRVLPRLKRKLGIAHDISSTPDIPTFDLNLAGIAAGGAVEHAVRKCLALEAPESIVRYVENGLINSLFGLLCWRAIFAPMAGAFFHDFPYGPADLGSAHFYRRRQQLFQECFAELESGEYQKTILSTYQDKAGIQSPFVSWNVLSENLLGWALACFPAAHLKRWFEWMVRDISVNRAGFPDLVQFWPRERRYRLIEVKGPGDRVQDNQRRLLEYCASHGMPVSVCWVR
jgi:hypothetical protein